MFVSIMGYLFYLVFISFYSVFNPHVGPKHTQRIAGHNMLQVMHIRIDNI